MKKIKRIVLKTEHYIANFEQFIIVLGLSVMIFFGALQVLLRNFFSTGIDWADLLVRALVLWLGFTGASLATRRNRHISIDAVSKFIKNPKLEILRRRIVGVISFLLCITLFKASIDFIMVESKSGISAFLGIPTWAIFIVVPVSLGLIAIRILISTLSAENIDKEAKELT